MADMNYDGTICANTVYTEKQIMHILDISQDQLSQYYRLGLPYYQATRMQRKGGKGRLIAGSVFHRFIERLSTCPDREDDGIGEEE